MEVLKRPRLSYNNSSGERHNDGLVHSLLNFSDKFNCFDPKFIVKKRHIPPPSEDELKLAPIKTVEESTPPYKTDFSVKIQRSLTSITKPHQESLDHEEPKLDGYNELQTNASLALADLPYSFSLQVVTQPVGYQIANYNIHPPPALSLDRSLLQNITIHAQLVEIEKKAVVDGGFQTGDVRVLRAGHTTLYFTGLKLNKMGPIKTELHFRDYKRIPTNFCIQFKIGNRTIYSDPFKLVSSCAQLPQDVRDMVRPTKKTSRSSPERDHAEDVKPVTPPLSMSTPSSPPSAPSPNNNFTNEALLRRELEDAIDSADAETAAAVARKLAFLKKSH